MCLVNCYLTEAVEVYECEDVCSYPAEAVEGIGVYYSGQMCDDGV